ncbi:MAG TPA: hypothetical protein VFU80_06490 [Sphingomicrobium sp.]|nr:hypothetical protein [Sphingomicrobium sp.]
MIAPATRRRLIAGAVGALLVVSAAAIGVVLRERSAPLPAPPPGERPELLLLTSLPIVFPEGFTLEDAGSPVLVALESRYDVVPLSTADGRSLSGHNLLLMAQPHAQPADILVELDQWVRGGGHALLLADPALEWPSDLPLGDLSRPPTAFPDTGLLGHWGLRLDAPDERGPRSSRVDQKQVRTASPGRLAATGPHCAVSRDGFVARCGIGRGRATVIADADFLDVEKVEGANRSRNLDFLLAELGRLEK